VDGRAGPLWCCTNTSTSKLCSEELRASDAGADPSAEELRLLVGFMHMQPQIIF